MADHDPILPPSSAFPPPKAIGVPCDNISGQMKMTLFHPSQPNTMLNYCENMLRHVRNYGFVEDIESGTENTIHFRYNGPRPRNHYAFPSAESNGLCPTPRLPRYKTAGLHPYTYRAFLDALNYYLQRQNTHDIFILRFVPVDVRDLNDGRIWNIAEMNGRTFVYAKNSLDIADYNRYHAEESH